MKVKLCEHLGLTWMDEFYELQNKGYSEDGAIIKIYNNYF